MFCYQCEQTAHHTGCTAGGVCGKTSEAARADIAGIPLSRSAQRTQRVVWRQVHRSNRKIPRLCLAQSWNMSTARVKSDIIYVLNF